MARILYYVVNEIKLDNIKYEMQFVFNFFKKNKLVVDDFNFFTFGIYNCFIGDSANLKLCLA